MSNGLVLLASVVWLSVVAFAALLVWMRRPTKRRTTDELESIIAALRARVIDLEDKHEHHIKRDAVRAMRDRRDETAQVSPDAPKAARLAALRDKARVRGLI